MKPAHQLEQELDELRQVGLDLYERAEKWRKALEEIKRLNSDPVISSIINEHLHH